MSKTTPAPETLQADEVTHTDCLPTAPPCPPWCESHRPGAHAGWNVSKFETSKWCERRRILRGVDGGTTEIVVSRFAYLDEDGSVGMDPPSIRIEDAGARHELRQARQLASALTEAASLLAETA